MSQGLDLTVELLAAIGTWGGIGWLVDRWLGTTPWLLAIGLLVGNACGIYLLFLHSRDDDEKRRTPEHGRRATEGEDGAST